MALPQDFLPLRRTLLSTLRFSLACGRLLPLTLPGRMRHRLLPLDGRQRERMLRLPLPHLLHPRRTANGDGLDGGVAAKAATAAALPQRIPPAPRTIAEMRPRLPRIAPVHAPAIPGPDPRRNDLHLLLNLTRMGFLATTRTPAPLTSGPPLRLCVLAAAVRHL